MKSVKKRFEGREAQTTLNNEMYKYYVDSDGKTIVEAVALGMGILEFFGALHKCMGVAKIVGDDKMMKVTADFFMSLVIENFTIESLDASSSTLDMQVAAIKEMNKEVGIEIDKCLYSEFKNILNNEFFRHAGCNIVMRTALIEGVTRIINCFVFLYSEYKNPTIMTMNLATAYHSLALIALLCDANIDNYYGMNLQVELYGYNIIKETVVIAEEREAH